MASITMVDPNNADEMQRALDRIKSLIDELGWLRDSIEAAQRGELRPRELAIDRRRRERRQGSDRRQSQS